MNGGLLVAIIAVQQQTGLAECGVMAIANAYHAASGDDLSKLQFVEASSMRNHLSRKVLFYVLLWTIQLNFDFSRCFENCNFVPRLNIYA